MLQVQNGVLVDRVAALNISENPPTPLIIESGTRFVVEIGKFEWLGHEGLYSEISLPDLPGCRFRVRYHQLHQAMGKTGAAVVFKPSSAVAGKKGSSASQ
jgi:hypothetical protein